MDFWLDLLLFLVAILPVFLLGVSPISAALVLWVRGSRLVSRNMTARSWSVFEVVGVIISFLVAYFWWASYCFSVLMQPHFVVPFPFMEVFLSLTLTAGFVKFIRSFRRFREEVVQGRYGAPSPAADPKM